MKKQILALTGGLILVSPILAQQVPTSNIPNDPNNAFYWSRTGNTNGTGLTSNNIFGTLWNSPIYTMTAFNYRTKLNGNVAYAVNGYANQSYNGYMLIGNNGTFSNGESIYTTNNRGAFSLLHLNGAGTTIQQLGYRPWMQTGITLTGNNDLSYFGLRRLDDDDRTETVIAWTDNQSSISDEMVFRFMGTSSGNTTLSTNMASPDDLDGLHVARFTPTGRFGLGNTFGHMDNPQSPGYNTPRSLLHLSYQYRPPSASDVNLNEEYGFMQVTYRRTPTATTDFIGQGEQANDGLRLGIDNQLFSGGAQLFLNAYLRWQETSSFIIQTEDGENGDNNIQNSERMRITSVGALAKTNSAANYIGNSGGIPENRTRIGLSSNGAAPVLKPMSLLHLGFDIDNTSTGWRNWMDIGSYTTNGTDNMYVGLKRESDDAQNDRFDAIINWGDNINANPNVTNGPDNLRFIFTANAVTGSGPAATNNGLEGARMTPTTVGVFTGIGGTPTVNPYYSGSDNPTATLEVNGWGALTTQPGGNSGLRFTNLNTTTPPVVNPAQGYLAVDAEGDVIYTYGPGGAGAPCGSAATVGALTSNYRVNLNNNNYYFLTMQASPSPTFNKVGVGYPCDFNLRARFNVLQKEVGSTPLNTIASQVDNTDVASGANQTLVGEQGYARGIQTVQRTKLIGGGFLATNGQFNYGVSGVASSGTWTSTTFSAINVAGDFAASQATSYGVRASATGTKTSTGVYGEATGAPINYGGYFTSAINPGTGNISYGIYATGGPDVTGNTVRAGYFAGRTESTNYPLNGSDQQFKDSVLAITGGLKTITQLKPVSFKFDIAGYPQFNFGAEQQYGFIAQQVQTVLPALVHDSYMPAQLDSLGDTITPAISYKSLNYTALIPMNTQAIIDLNKKVESITLSDAAIKTNVTDLDSSLAKVLEMRGVSYDWNHAVHPELNLDSANHIGFIAQEIAAIDPRLTRLGDDSLLHVEYDKVVPVLAEAIQELNNQVESKDSIINVLITENTDQQTTIDDLNARLTNLENCLSALLPTLCSMNQSLIQNNSVEQQELVRKNLAVMLSDRTAIILDQNVPNPFAEQTVINFSIPATIQKAQIHFYDGNGKIIQSVDIVERGPGSITVFGTDLSSGTYTYTLVADGKIVATKKMVKQP